MSSWYHRRAMVPIFLSMAPPFPMIILSLLSHTMIVARIWIFVRLLITLHRVDLYCDEWGISSRVNEEPSHESFLKPRNASGWDLISWEILETFLHTRISIRWETLFLKGWDREQFKVHLVTEIINLEPRADQDEPYQSYSPPEITGTLAAFRRSIIISSPFPRGSSLAPWKNGIHHEACCRQIPPMKSPRAAFGLEFRCIDDLFLIRGVTHDFIAR